MKSKRKKAAKKLGRKTSSKPRAKKSQSKRFDGMMHEKLYSALYRLASAPNDATLHKLSLEFGITKGKRAKKAVAKKKIAPAKSKKRNKTVNKKK